MTTIENNRIVAEFMELKKCKGITNNSGRYFDYWADSKFSCILEGVVYIECEEGLGLVEQDLLFVEQLRFHSDWGWLMQVVEKIESLKTPIVNNPNLTGQFEEYDFVIENKFVAIYAHGEVTKDVYQGKRDTKIEAVYSACVEFIKWYNEQNKVS
jgi:hypothetical protein